MISFTVDNLQGAYIESVLDQSGLLGQTLKTRLKDSWQGEVTTKGSISPTHPFQAGGVCGRRESIEGLTTRLHELLSMPGNIGILYNESFKSADSVISTYTWPVFEGEDVYHVIPSGSSTDMIRRSLLDADSGVSLVGVVFHYDDNKSLHPKANLSKDVVIKWANVASHVFVEICDGETFLIWAF